MAMPRGFADLIRRKYELMQQAQNTTRLGTEAAANLDRVRAGLMPAESRANIGKILADTGFTDVQTREFGPTAAAQRALWGTQGDVNRAQIPVLGAQAGLYRAQTGETQANTIGINQLNEMNTIGTRAPRMADVLFPREEGEGAVNYATRRLRSMWGGY